MDVDYLGENAAEAGPHQVRSCLNISSTFYILDFAAAEGVTTSSACLST